MRLFKNKRQAALSTAPGMYAEEDPAQVIFDLRLDSLRAKLIEMFAKPAEISSRTVRVIRDVTARDGLETVHLRVQQQAASEGWYLRR